jgi:hypothetical protein
MGGDLFAVQLPHRCDRVYLCGIQNHFRVLKPSPVVSYKRDSSSRGLNPRRMNLMGGGNLSAFQLLPFSYCPLLPKLTATVCVEFRTTSESLNRLRWSHTSGTPLNEA